MLHGELFRPSLADFEAYIGLTQQQLTNVFVKSIQSHARAKFYTKNDPNCIYAKQELGKRIQTDHATALAFQPSPTNAFALLPQPSSLSTAQAKQLRQKLWIRSTQFSKLVGAREFHWISHIDVVRVYEFQSQQGLSAIQSIKRIKIVGFDVRWKSNVKSDGRFHDIEIDGIDLGTTQLLEATEENLQQWGALSLP